MINLLDEYSPGIEFESGVYEARVLLLIIAAVVIAIVAIAVIALINKKKGEKKK